MTAAVLNGSRGQGAAAPRKPLRKGRGKGPGSAAEASGAADADASPGGEPRGGEAGKGHPQPLASSSASKSSAKHINLALVRAADAGDVEGLLNIAAANLDDMTCVNISTALHKLARFARDGFVLGAGDSRFLMLHKKTEQELERQTKDPDSEALPRCWSTISWAYGKMQARGIETVAVFNAITRLSLPHLEDFQPFELTNLIWGCAKMQAPNVKLFQAVQQHMSGSMRSFSAANLCTMAWSCVTARQWQASVLQQIAEEFVRQLPTAVEKGLVTPVEISNLVWSLATASVQPSQDALQQVGDAGAKMLTEFKVQELSITAWAFSRLDARHDNLFAAIAWYLETSQRMQQTVHSQGVANLMWALQKQAVMGSAAPERLRAAVLGLMRPCGRLLPQLKPQEFACVFRTLGRLGLRWGSNQEADALFTSGAAGGPALQSLSLLQVVDVLEAFTHFLSTGCGPERPPVFAEYLAALLHACLGRVGDLWPSSAIHLLSEAAMATSLLGPRREHFVGVVASLALNMGPESFQLSGQATLAAMCGLRYQGGDLDGLRRALSAVATRTGPGEWGSAVGPAQPGRFGGPAAGQQMVVGPADPRLDVETAQQDASVWKQRAYRPQQAQSYAGAGPGQADISGAPYLPHGAAAPGLGGPPRPRPPGGLPDRSRQSGYPQGGRADCPPDVSIHGTHGYAACPYDPMGQDGRAACPTDVSIRCIHGSVLGSGAAYSEHAPLGPSVRQAPSVPTYALRARDFQSEPAQFYMSYPAEHARQQCATAPQAPSVPTYTLRDRGSQSEPVQPYMNYPAQHARQQCATAPQAPSVHSYALRARDFQSEPVQPYMDYPAEHARQQCATAPQAPGVHSYALRARDFQSEPVQPYTGYHAEHARQQCATDDFQSEPVQSDMGYPAEHGRQRSATHPQGHAAPQAAPMDRLAVRTPSGRLFGSEPPRHLGAPAQPRLPGSFYDPALPVEHSRLTSFSQSQSSVVEGTFFEAPDVSSHMRRVRDLRSEPPRPLGAPALDEVEFALSQELRNVVGGRLEKQKRKPVQTENIPFEMPPQDQPFCPADAQGLRASPPSLEPNIASLTHGPAGPSEDHSVWSSSPIAGQRRDGLSTIPLSAPLWRASDHAREGELSYCSL